MSEFSSILGPNVDPLWICISIVLVLIVALLFRYELRFIRTLPQQYRLSVIVTDVLHMLIGLGLLSMFVFRLYMNKVGVHVITWGIVIWVVLSAYNVLSRPKLLIKIVRPEKEEINLLVEQLKKAKQDSKSKNNSV